MFASANSAFSPIAQKGAATLVCPMQSLSLQPPRARARDRIPSPWPASARAERRASMVKPISFKKTARKPRMAKRPLRKAAPTAGGVLRDRIEIPGQSLVRALLTLGWTPPAGTRGSAMAPPACSDQDDDALPIVVEWSPPPMTPPPMTPPPACFEELRPACAAGSAPPMAPPSPPSPPMYRCMQGYVTPVQELEQLRQACAFTPPSPFEC